jgi:SAM-dependent methyltransferase
MMARSHLDTDGHKAADVTALYQPKPLRYYAGARHLFIDDLPPNPTGRLLEIGCGNGDTSAYALAQRKCGCAVGVELCRQPGLEAAARLSAVFIGNIESLELPYAHNYFDILILSEILEHVTNPHSVLTRLRPLLREGAIVLAGSPNVAHYSVLLMLLSGRWDYRPSGILDDTHLRWFTPHSYRRLFEDCGYSVDFAVPARSLGLKAATINALTFGRFTHLLHTQIYLRARRR